MWFSISHDSSTERLIFILMLIIFVIHLLEASYPFRMIEIKALIADPLFCLEQARLNFEIKNTSNVRSEPCFIKLRNDKQWIRIDPLEAHSSQIVPLKITFQNPGIQTVPAIQIKTFTDSGLQRFWRTIDPKKEIAVLPRPIDHGIQANREEFDSQNEELNNLEEIHDPSRFKFTDPKLFKRPTEGTNEFSTPDKLQAKLPIIGQARKSLLEAKRRTILFLAKIHGRH